MARDVAQRELDQAGFRITNLGDPQAPSDATRTDNQSVPRPNAGVGLPGTSLLAAPADHVHPASPAASGLAIVGLDDPTYQTVTGRTEEVVYEAFVDPAPLITEKIEVAFAAVVRGKASGLNVGSVSLGRDCKRAISIKRPSVKTGCRCSNGYLGFTTSHPSARSAATN